MRVQTILNAAFTLALGFAAVAHAKPNFSGDWKMNAEKSEFGPMPPPTSMTMKIEHSEPDIKVATAQSGGPQGDLNYELKYSTDGKETTNAVGPMEAKSTAKWEGDNLTVNTKVDGNGLQFTITAKWTLSEDGNALTQTDHIASPQGEIDLKRVFEKQTK